jgi:hypothetical protein
VIFGGVLFWGKRRYIYTYPPGFFLDDGMAAGSYAVMSCCFLLLVCGFVQI